MKMGTEHLVPLSRQALELLELLHGMTGKYDLVFPSERDRSRVMPDNTIRKAIFMLGYDGKHEGKSKAIPHGFRATACALFSMKRGLTSTRLSVSWPIRNVIVSEQLIPAMPATWMNVTR